ncbi:MAG: hypothetical protein JNJ46_29830 [Myxococcales bacterium]|nr:hypothetical protein [Myxococcales bacterium]
MDERHENEQYFFDGPTLDRLAAFVCSFARPCCVCAPLLGRAVSRRGHSVRILDIDERFADTPGFLRWDLNRPIWLDEAFDLIVCDPPFFNVSLSRLFRALRVLSQNRFDQPVLISYPTRRGSNLMATFHRFGLQPSGYFPRYLTVQASERNTIEFYSNLGSDHLAALRGVEAVSLP